VNIGSGPPQVLTEALYGLDNTVPAFMLTEIHLITTSEGSYEARPKLERMPCLGRG